MTISAHVCFLAKETADSSACVFLFACLTARLTYSCTYWSTD